LGGGVGQLNVFEGAGVVFGGKEVIAFFMMETFADVFESVGEGPADADRLFGQGKGLFALGVHEVVGLNPMDWWRMKYLARVAEESMEMEGG